jgi:hypothetical protein
MPRININEKDYTSPGASLDYANYAVLIAGFEGAEPAEGELEHPLSLRLAEHKPTETAEGTKPVYYRPVKPDSNGVYEFISANDFEETIGLCAPRHELDGGNKIMYHYGNQMAYELLKLGYTVVYKPIKSVDELTREDFWEVFKDRSSYDFRFISHGLLTSDPTISDFLKDPEVLAKNALIALADSVFADCAPNYRKTLTLITESGAFVDMPAIELNNISYIRNSTIDLAKTITSFEDLSEEVRATKLDIINSSFSEMLIQGGINYNKNVANWVAQEALKAKKSKITDYVATFENCWNSLGEHIATKNAGLSTAVDAKTMAQANTCIANLAAYKAADTSRADSDEAALGSGRGDCLALIELDESIYTATSTSKPENLIIAGLRSDAVGTIDGKNGKYCAMTIPSVFYSSLSTEPKNVWEGNNKLPGAFHYLACFMNSLNLGYREWYAAAGYTRGVPSLVVDKTSIKLGELAINALEPRYITDNSIQPKFACNVVANFRGSYYLWGNRTAHPLGKKGDAKNGDLVASSFLNIRHLCTTIKKQLYYACRQFTFDPNSDTLWINFCEAIKPTLEAMKADQGVRDYRIIKVPTDTKATLKAKIRIVPIEAVEDFILEVSLEDSFGETNATVTE